MSYIWEFFEKANELAYVSDIDSYEILYMNPIALEAYGVSSLNELKGRRCYEVFYGNDSPCTICHSGRLQEGKYLKRKQFNQLLNRYFLFMDTIVLENGRRCRFTLGIDINEYENTKHEDMEARINEGIKYAICEPEPDISIHIILEFLGKTLNAERTYIIEKNEMCGDNNTYEWADVNKILKKDNFPNVYGDPVQYANLKRQNIHSSVVVPLYDDGQIIGFYGIDNPLRQDLGYMRNTLQFVGCFIGSMLKRRDTMKQLCKMSLFDQLTKLGNRYAMDEYVADIEGGRSLGVAYCDITGLKIINDTMGHKAGDALICRASESLKSVLGDYGLFRIGGDELLALCVDIEQDVFKERVTLLREKAAQNSVNLAVGAVWETQYREEPQRLINEAEKLMYKEKSEYYRRSGIDRRR